MFGASNTQRLFFFNGFLFAAATGFCLGMFVTGRIVSVLGIKA